MLTIDYDPQKILQNIILMESREFGEPKKWKTIKIKLQKNKQLDEYEYQYYLQVGEEYTLALERKRNWQYDKIEELAVQGIGNKDRWMDLKHKLKNGENLQGIDYEYFLAKLMSVETFFASSRSNDSAILRSNNLTFLKKSNFCAIVWMIKRSLMNIFVFFNTNLRVLF